MSRWLKFKYSANRVLHSFHIVKNSQWPVMVALSLGLALLYTVLWLHEYTNADTCFVRILILSWPIFFYSFINWLWDIIIEGLFEGRHTRAVQNGLRVGFVLFIVSEVIFFVSFFWAFFHSSISPSIWIGAVWPPLGIKTLSPWGWPFVNTVILLSSGITVTWAHKVLSTRRSNVKSDPIKIWNARLEGFKGLLATIFLGVLFTWIQLYEYQNSLFNISDSIYGSVFFLLTGFHGLHVLIGTIFLLVCTLRHFSYHFARDHQLGLEIAIWYWHFVDIVWIFLFIFVYVWGA